MKYLNEAVLTMLLNVQAFKDRYTEVLGKAALAPSWDRLKEVIADLSGSAAEQVQHGKLAEHGTATKAELRFVLRMHHMQEIWTIARAQLLDIPMSKLSKFDVPPASASDVSLIAAAHAMAIVAYEFRQTFFDEGLSVNFVEELQGAATALQNAIVERDGDKLQSRRARIGAETQVHSARELLLILSASVRKVLAKHPELIAEWNATIKVRQKPGLARGAAARAAAAAVAPAPVTGPATSSAPTTGAPATATGPIAVVKAA